MIKISITISIIYITTQYDNTIWPSPTSKGWIFLYVFQKNNSILVIRCRRDPRCHVIPSGPVGHCCSQFLKCNSCVPGDGVRIRMGPGSSGRLGEPPKQDVWYCLIFAAVAVTGKYCSPTCYSCWYWRKFTIDLLFGWMSFPGDVFNTQKESCICTIKAV